MPSKTIFIFIAKPGHMSFGGNDAFAMHLARNWKSNGDRVIFAFNATNPCRELFVSRIQEHAQIEIFDAPMITEKRFAVLRRYPSSPARRFIAELWIDIRRPFQSAAAVVRFCGLLKRVHPDAVILNIGGNPPEDLGWRMMLAAWLRRVPHIILVNQSYPGQGTNIVRRAALFILRRMTRYFCDVVVAPSQDMANVFAESMKDNRPPLVIPYGIDSGAEYGVSLEEKRKILRLDQRLVIGMVGNAEERKGLHVLIKAMPALLREFPDLMLVLIGSRTDPAYAAHLDELVETLNLQAHVRNMGPMKDAGQYFECFDVCVVPSTYAEGFGMVAIEALRYSKPVVATTSGGLKEVIVDGETGFVVPTSDVEALSEALLKLLRSPELRRKMGENSLARFTALYKTSAMMANYYKLVHSAGPK